MSQYAHLSEPDPEWLAIASKFEPEVDPPPLEQLRIRMSRYAKSQNELWDPPYPKSGLKVEETKIPVEDASIAVRTYVPDYKANETTFPVLVWFHGGGFIFGDLEFDDALLRLICVNQRVSCVNVDYRLAPENKFPIPVNDCYRATQWAAANADSLSADLTKGFIVGGSSAGGNLAAVVSLKSRDDPSFKVKLTGQLLQIPFLCPPEDFPEKWKGELISHVQNKDCPTLRESDREKDKSMYGAPDPITPDYAPLLAESHANLPAAYLQICGFDPLRDEAFLYDKLLRESGVRSKFDVYPGQPHAFHMIGPHMAQSKKFIQDIKNGVAWILRAK